MDGNGTTEINWPEYAKELKGKIISAFQEISVEQVQDAYGEVAVFLERMPEEEAQYYLKAMHARLQEMHPLKMLEPSKHATPLIAALEKRDRAALTTLLRPEQPTIEELKAIRHIVQPMVGQYKHVYPKALETLESAKQMYQEAQRIAHDVMKGPIFEAARDEAGNIVEAPLAGKLVEDEGAAAAFGRLHEAVKAAGEAKAAANAPVIEALTSSATKLKALKIPTAARAHKETAGKTIKELASLVGAAITDAHSHGNIPFETTAKEMRNKLASDNEAKKFPKKIKNAIEDLAGALESGNSAVAERSLNTIANYRDAYKTLTFLSEQKADFRKNLENHAQKLMPKAAPVLSETASETRVTEHDATKLARSFERGSTGRDFSEEAAQKQIKEISDYILSQKDEPEFGEICKRLKTLLKPRTNGKEARLLKALESGNADHIVNALKETEGGLTEYMHDAARHMLANWESTETAVKTDVLTGALKLTPHTVDNAGYPATEETVEELLKDAAQTARKPIEDLERMSDKELKEYFDEYANEHNLWPTEAEERLRRERLGTKEAAKLSESELETWKANSESAGELLSSPQEEDKFAEQFFEELEGVEDVDKWLEEGISGAAEEVEAELVKGLHPADTVGDIDDAVDAEFTDVAEPKALPELDFEGNPPAGEELDGLATQIPEGVKAKPLDSAAILRKNGIESAPQGDLVPPKQPDVLKDMEGSIEPPKSSLMDNVHSKLKGLKPKKEPKAPKPQPIKTEARAHRNLGSTGGRSYSRRVRETAREVEEDSKLFTGSNVALGAAALGTALLVKAHSDREAQRENIDNILNPNQGIQQ